MPTFVIDSLKLVLLIKVCDRTSTISYSTVAMFFKAILKFYFVLVFFIKAILKILV